MQYNANQIVPKLLSDWSPASQPVSCPPSNLIQWKPSVFVVAVDLLPMRLIFHGNVGRISSNCRLTRLFHSKEEEESHVGLNMANSSSNRVLPFLQMAFSSQTAPQIQV